LRTSERKDFKRCQQKWQWAWRNGLKPLHEKPGALWFGIGIHLALQERYKYKGTRRGQNVLKVWRDYVGEEMANVYVGEDFDKSEVVNAGDLGEEMLGAYLDKYGKDEKWYVISAEQTFEIPIPRPAGYYDERLSRGDNPTLTTYNGTFDLVALNQETENSLWLWDHKTAKAIQTNHLSLDDQAGSYWAVAADVLAAQGLIEPGMKLDGILYNFLRKAKTDTRPTNAAGQALNKDGSISKIQPAQNFVREEVWRTRAERRTQIRKIQAEALQIEAVRNRVLPITKNPTDKCAWECPFFQMCELQDSGEPGEWKEYRDLAFRKVDPYADHRKTTEA
jgi:hypothetical protein